MRISTLIEVFSFGGVALYAWCAKTWTPFLFFAVGYVVASFVVGSLIEEKRRGI